MEKRKIKASRSPLYPVLVALCALPLWSCSSTPGAGGGGIAPADSGWRGSTLVRTSSGALRGREDRNGTLSWLGIPYAEPPVGELRWTAPRTPRAWEGIRSATAFRGWSPQRGVAFDWPVGTEDCLYLNLWRPAKGGDGLPVYVYLHGGGNSFGAANQVADYLGWGVASKSNMVFVSLNYRLGPFGWFLDPAITEGRDPDTASGNFGTLDILKALEWIRNNVAAFGGDPGNVTLAGESAGGLNVLSLLTSPRSAGLFHRAIVESGYQLSSSREEALAASERIFRKILVARGLARNLEEAAGVSASLDPGQRARLLRGAKTSEFVRLQDPFMMGMTDWPSVIRDGSVIPEEGFEVFEEGRWPNKVPLVIGSNKEETKIFLYVGRLLDPRSPLYQKAARFGGLSWKASGVDEVADRMARSPDAPPVYVYRFDWGAPDASGGSPQPGDWGRKMGAFHASEVGFFLGTESCLGPLFTGALLTAGNRPGREALTRGIMGYLAAFARTGDPNAGETGLPEWPRRPPDALAAASRGEPVGIVFDAGAKEARIAPLKETVTREGVRALMGEELSEEEAEAIAELSIVR